MNLRKKGNLTREENFEIASTLQLLVLDGVFKSEVMSAPNAVFHGGTSLSVARNSPRFSEDLDFLVSEKAAEALPGVVAKSFEDAASSISSVYPGSVLKLAGPRGDEVSQWLIRWEHPNRRGVVKVKLEFMSASPFSLSNYRSSTILPVPKVGSFVRLESAIPVPELVAAWGDKIKAVATRPVLKWRDVHDLAFVANAMPSPRDYSGDVEAVLESAEIYGVGLDEVADGLMGVLSSVELKDVVSFEKDMRRWLPEDVWENMSSAGVFRKMHRTGVDEIAKATDAIELRRESAFKP